MVLRRQLQIGRRWLPLLLLGILLAAVPAYMFSSRQAPVFQATATLLPERLLPTSEPDFNQISIDRLVGLSNTWSLVAKAPQVLDAVNEQLALGETSTSLGKQVDATVDANNALLTITARASTAEGAAALANAVATAIAQQSSQTAANDPTTVEDVGRLRDKILATQAEYERLLNLPQPVSDADQQQLTSTLALLGALNASYDSLAASIRRPPEGLDVIDPAVAAEASQVAPRTIYYTLLAAVVGLLVAAGIAYAMQYFDDRVKSPGDVAQTTGLVTLGAIGRRRRFTRHRERFTLATLRDPGSTTADAYRSLKANVDLAAGAAGVHTLLVASASPTSGKTMTAANLAIAYAQAGRRVVLVDGDLRRPAVHTLFGLTNTDGLTSLVSDESAPLSSVARRIPGQENLLVLTSGPIPLDSAGVLGSAGMTRLIERARIQADLIVFDSAPLDTSVDAAVLGGHVAGTLLVVDATRDGSAAVAEACDTLERASATIMGAVLFSAQIDGFAGSQGGSPTGTREGIGSTVALEQAER